MIYRNISFVSSVNFFTRILGYIRDLLIAFVFGTSSKAELFIILLEIKEIFNIFFHSLSFEKNLINKYLQKTNKITRLRFSNNIFFSFLIFVVISTLLSLMFSDKIFFTLFPGFESRFETEYINRIIKFVLLSNIFNFIIVYLSSILQAEKKFAFNSYILILPNLFFLIYFYLITKFFENNLINDFFGYFIILVSIFQLILVIFKKDLIIFGSIYFKFRDLLKDLSEFLSSYIYSFLFIIVFTIYRFLEKFFLSFEEGLISMFHLSERVAYLPTAIIITAFSTVLLPEFFSKKKKLDKNKLEIFSNALVYCLIIMLYVCLFYILNSEIIINILFGRGNFDQDSVEVTSKIFTQKTFGIFFVAFQLILYVFYISKKKNKTILIGSVIGLIFSLIYMLILFNIGNYEYFGLNLLIFYSIQVFYLFYKLEDRNFNLLKKNVLSNMKFIYSYTIISLILIILKKFFYIEGYIMLLISLILISIHFFMSIKLKLIKDKRLYNLIKIS